MALTFANLKHDLAGRGFSDLSDTRQSRYINRGPSGARTDVFVAVAGEVGRWNGTRDGHRPWCDRAVTNETQDYRLQGAQFRDLLDCYADPSTSGSPFGVLRGGALGHPCGGDLPDLERHHRHPIPAHP